MSLCKGKSACHSMDRSKIILLSEVSQLEKDKCHILPPLIPIFNSSSPQGCSDDWSLHPFVTSFSFQTRFHSLLLCSFCVQNFQLSVCVRPTLFLVSCSWEQKAKPTLVKPISAYSSSVPELLNMDRLGVSLKLLLLLQWFSPKVAFHLNFLLSSTSENINMDSLNIPGIKFLAPWQWNIVIPKELVLFKDFSYHFKN